MPAPELAGMGQPLPANCLHSSSHSAGSLASARHKLTFIVGHLMKAALIGTTSASTFDSRELIVERFAGSGAALARLSISFSSREEFGAQS